MSKYYQMTLLLFLVGCTGKKINQFNSTFKIADEPNIEVTHKIQRLETQAGFKNISLGRTLGSFNFGQEWVIQTKTDFFGRNFGDSIITAFTSSYHEKIGESKIQYIDLTFINDTLKIIEVRMEPRTFGKYMTIKPNLFPILVENFGKPNKIKYSLAKYRNQCNVLLDPSLELAFDSVKISKLKQKPNPYFHVRKPEDFTIAAWQVKQATMEFIESPSEPFVKDQLDPKYEISEILRYFLPGTDSLGTQICKKVEFIQENRKQNEQKRKIKEEASKL